MNIYLDLYLTFAKIGAVTFGGGMAMLPILQREVVDKKGWATNDELTDYYAIGQCTPGIIAVNTATFVGYQNKGTLGGVLATLGVVSPSVVIISLIATLLTTFADIPAVQHAMVGINAGVVALIAASVVKLGKTSIKDKVCANIFLVVLLWAFFTDVSPALLVVAAGLTGYVTRRMVWLRKGGGER